MHFFLHSGPFRLSFFGWMFAVSWTCFLFCKHFRECECFALQVACFLFHFFAVLLAWEIIYAGTQGAAKKMSRWRPVEWNIFFRNLPFSLVTCTFFCLRLCLISFSHFFVLCFFGVHFARLAGPTTTTTGGWSNISDRQSFANTKKTCCGVSLPAFFCSLVAKGFTEKISSNCVLLPFSVCRRLSN